MTPAFERAKKAHALDSAVTVIGAGVYYPTESLAFIVTIVI
jgi:hypothetical protein